MAERSEDWWGQAEGDLKRRKIDFYERRSEFDRHDGTVTGKFKLVWDVIEPTKNECFEVVLCFDVIEHLFDPDYLLTEAFRVLAWGGCIVITTPNLASWYNRICLFAGWQPFWTEVSTRFVIGNPIRKRRMMKEEIMPSGHLRVFTTKALRELLERYNFSVEIIKGYPFFNGKSLGLLDSTLSRSSNLASFVMIKAKKLRK